MKSKEKSAHFEQTMGPDPELVSSIATFIVIGKTGVGKSSFIKSLGGRSIDDDQEPIVDEGIDSCTKTPTMYRATVNKTEIILVDTPGFDDSGIENLEILRGTIAILHFLAIQKSCFPIHGIVFLHDISEVKFSGSQRKTLSILRALCGEKCMGNVIVGTTRWSPERPAKFKKEEERERKFLGEHWGGVYMTRRWIDEDDSGVPVQIVMDLLAKPQILLLAQKEMLKPPHAVEDTTVGKLVTPEADLEMKQKLAEKEQEFEEEMAKRCVEAEEMRMDYKEKMEQFQRGRDEDKAKMEADFEKIKRDHQEQYQKERAEAKAKMEADAAKMKSDREEQDQKERAKYEAKMKKEFDQKMADEKARIEAEGAEQMKKELDQKMADEKARIEAEAKKQKMARGQVELLYDKFKAGELSFAEKFGLAIAAPIILAPAAFVAAPVGVIASLVHLAEKLNKPPQNPGHDGGGTQTQETTEAEPVMKVESVKGVSDIGG